MFSVKYISQNKKYLIYKNNIPCATYQNDILVLKHEYTLSINEISDILDLCNFQK
ncbi:MAG: hypothetical protein IJH34_11730 [Romboutsia sp.]|nr:hypothetical protein [Romboutsia sp.]